ncbi:metallophosphoesterase family protein [Humisphaera borealis]|uniref:Metallophosphoesterase n=1 Tax=Humisphaera borealis TaxID=2807512 RepID=A0A7M2WT27_9BACT|nr:metallophosphoesterase [Humisphaera borealis]QOV88569.1 metallophosphoesterase [Humisphaera borealis]
MRTIAHISDLHFGRLDAPVAEGLIADLAGRKPDLLVVSGDLTQRARRRQYADAMAFLKRLPSPQLVVPGNHDIPMFNMAARFFTPVRKYRQMVTRDLRPVYEDEQMLVIGLNSARSFTRISGWLNREQMAFAEARFAAAKGKFKVLVTHHPFFPPPRRPDANVIRGGEKYLAALSAVEVDLVLSGHLHLAYHDDLRSHFKASRRGVLSIQAGTATSTRRRGEPNAYNWITVSPQLCTVAVRAWAGKAFEESLVTRYESDESGWHKIQQVPIDQVGAEVMSDVNKQ